MSVRNETTTSLARLHRNTRGGHVWKVEVNLVGKPSRGGCESSKYQRFVPPFAAPYGIHFVGKTSRGGCESGEFSIISRVNFRPVVRNSSHHQENCIILHLESISLVRPRGGCEFSTQHHIGRPLPSISKARFEPEEDITFRGQLWRATFCQLHSGCKANSVAITEGDV